MWETNCTVRLLLPTPPPPSITTAMEITWSVAKNNRDRNIADIWCRWEGSDPLEMRLALLHGKLLAHYGLEFTFAGRFEQGWGNILQVFAEVSKKGQPHCCAKARPSVVKTCLCSDISILFPTSTYLTLTTVSMLRGNRNVLQLTTGISDWSRMRWIQGNIIRASSRLFTLVMSYTKSNNMHNWIWTKVGIKSRSSPTTKTLPHRQYYQSSISESLQHWAAKSDILDLACCCILLDRLYPRCQTSMFQIFCQILRAACPAVI